MAESYTFPFDRDLLAIKNILVVGAGKAAANILAYIQHHNEFPSLDFLLVGNDRKALERNPLPEQCKLYIDERPEIGQSYSQCSIDAIRSRISDDYIMAIVVAPLGGATGTGLSPVIARIFKERMLTVCIASMPFSLEGNSRADLAQEGVEMLRANADAVITYTNDYLIDLYGALSLKVLFQKSDAFFKHPVDCLVRSITVHGRVNIDFRDLYTILHNSGLSAFAYSSANGTDRAVKAAENLLVSSNISNVNIDSITKIILSIETGSQPPTMDEVTAILQIIQSRYKQDSFNILWSVMDNPSLGDGIVLNCILSGFYEQDTASLSEPENYEIGRQVPIHLVQAVEKIKSDHPGKTIAFLIMRFTKGRHYDNIVSVIKKSLADKDIVVLRADDKQYHDDVLYNILAYIYACHFGIAVFDRITDNTVNPNITFEVGYMMGLNKDVCLLKERSMQSLNTDIIGRLYREFDIQEIDTTIAPGILKWIEDKELLS